MASEFEVNPPGWLLNLPSGWHVRSFGYTDTIPTDLAAHVLAGLAAKTQAGSRAAVWPVTESGDPIAGFDAVIRGGRHLEPARLVEVALVDLEPPIVLVPAVTAQVLGFIGPAERDVLIAGADAANAASVARVLKSAKKRFQHDGEEIYDEFVAAASNLTKFTQLANRHHFRFFARRPTWSWDIGSIRNALATHESAPRVEWLTAALADKTTRALESDMELAWHKAFWLGRTAPNEADV